MLQNPYDGCLRATVKSGFLGLERRPGDFGSEATRCAIKPILGPMESALAKSVKRPAHSYHTTPIADIRGRSRFFYGDPDGPHPYDTLRFTFLGRADATDARNQAGRKSGARVSGTNAFKFHTRDGFSDDPEERVGRMLLGSLRKLQPYETLLRVDVLANGKLVHRTRAGGQAAALDLLEDTTYEVRFLYAMAVPPTIDPPFRADYMVRLIPAAAFAPIPEPSAGLLILGGAMVLLKRRRAATASLPVLR